MQMSSLNETKLTIRERASEMGGAGLENAFVNKCIIPERRKRLLFELSRPNKREVFLGRFAHNTESLLKTNVIEMVIDAEHIPQKYFSGELYVLSFTKEDGKFISAEKAMEYISQGYGPLIILSSHGKAMIKTEENRVYLLSFDIP